jgi:small-conductance mechanosensitive channel/CRP-like cAMP-binding protein
VPHQTTHLLLTLGAIGVAIALMFGVRNPLIRRRLLFTVAILVAAVAVHHLIRGLPETAWLQANGWKVEGLLLAYAGIQAAVTLAFHPWFTTQRKERVPAIVQDAIIVVLLAALAIVAFPNAEFLTTSAIVAAIIGFALQETLGNAFAGIALQADRPFRVGHWITVQDFEGEVREITWRATKIWTKQGNMVILPNSFVAGAAINNYSEPLTPTRLYVEVGVGYQIPPNEARDALLEALHQAPIVLADPPPSALLWDFAASALLFRVHFWIADYSMEETARDVVRRAIYYELGRRGIEIPWPIQIEYQREEAPVDVDAQRERYCLAIAAVPILAPLPADAQRALAESARERLFGEGEIVLREGEPGASMFIVLQGEVAVTIGEPPRQVALVGAGGYIGEMSILTGDPRRATVRARRDSRLVEIAGDVFRKCVQGNPGVIEQLAAAATTRRQELEQVALAPADQAERRQSLARRMRQFFGL